MSGFNFGTGTTGGGFSFGATASTPAASSGGFTMGNLGTATTTTTTSSLGLGSSLFAQKPASGFSFGAPAAGTAAPATGLTLGAPAATTTASNSFLGFGKPAASATPFSLTASSAPTGLTLGTALTSIAPAPQAGSIGFSLSLGATPATSATAPSGLMLGSTSGMGSNLFNTANASEELLLITLTHVCVCVCVCVSDVSLLFVAALGQPALGGLGMGSFISTSTSTAPPASTSVGLGGIDLSSSEKNNKSSGARPEDSKALKDDNLPTLICQDVENFQKFVKEQKQVEEEISRMSSKAMLKVQDDIKSLKQLLSVSASTLQRNSLAINKLKMETAQELKNADIAIRTQKTPPGLQHENTAPSDYFRALIGQFEVQLQQYRQQIEELENHLTTQGNGPNITPQDLSLAMQKLYQTFVALAAQLQSVHENVKILKHQYLGYRKAFLEDSTDVFQSKRAAGQKWQSAPRVTTGPTPFSSVPNAAAVAMAATLTQQQQPAPGPQPPLGVGLAAPLAPGLGAGLGSGLGAFGSGPGFGGVTAGGSSFGFASSSKPSGGSLSAGFGTSSTSGFNFSNPGINASAGLTFGVSNPPAAGFGASPPLLQLKKPPAGNKRGKR
ncbi:nucleoporin p58/p45 isoform X1 [Anguilla rostrata]|uniref:nucleoporin p58/p45 isoform X1 n=1 Tax=Anguilla rostrata TaxID=7938 RepID=UPI0030D360FB